ncbi:magnesium transporter [Acholeplasma equirhinis]|uniref:magnesium transporter n=1 Tax=Acholeplasma equirhinis TaxID=555393 RepID=UPI00197B015B|nr:magnesium transporter [Acholeplasma equirhinis]MBN3490049.1 magnesium transporter [Acholeplasma equirhinis]
MAKSIRLTNQALKLKLSKIHESDIATIFEEYPNDQLRIFTLLGVMKFSEVFILLDEDIQKVFYQTLSIEQKKSLLKALEVDDLKTFIELFPVKDHLSILNLLSKNTKLAVEKLLSYDVGSAGSISSPHFIALTIDTTVKEATHFVTTESTEKDEVDVIFFYDEHKVYKGAIRLQELILARANQNLSKLIDDTYPYVHENDDMQIALKKIQDYDLDMIPVLNKEKHIVGVITADDALVLMEEFHLDTVAELVKVHEVDEDDSPLKRTIVRLPWLLISAILNIAIASLLAVFQGTLEAHVALILFQPLILGMAGNIGTQSISVTILGLHQNQIEAKKHIGKELAIGAINSLVAGLVGMGLVYVFLMILPSQTDTMIELALTVGISLFFAMFISALAGVLLPFILKKFGADEKAASGPLISTINDFTALGVYFLVATIILMLI